MTPPSSDDPKSLVREAYDRASQAYRGDTYDLRRSGYGHWLGRLESRLAQGARVLDLGCGNGVPVSRELARRFDVTGVDLSPVQIARARRLVPRARFVCADMTAIELPRESFDAVVAFYSIINVPIAEQHGLIERIAGWLKPGGWALAVVGRRAQSATERDFRGVRGATMFWSYGDVEDYRACFEQAGIAIEEEGVQPPQGDPGFAVLIGRRRPE